MLLYLDTFKLLYIHIFAKIVRIFCRKVREKKLCSQEAKKKVKPCMPLNLSLALPLPMPLQLAPALPLPMHLPLPMEMDPVFTTFFRSARAAFIGRVT